MPKFNYCHNYISAYIDMSIFRFTYTVNYEPSSPAINRVVLRSNELHTIRIKAYSVIYRM